MALPIGSIASLAAAGAALAITLWRFRLGRRRGRVDSDWLLEFSSDRYAILGTLLAGDDYDWILRETGGGRRLWRELRSGRRKAFRSYLAELSRDFSRLRLASRTIIADSPQDGTEIAGFVFRQTAFFRFQLLTVYVRLALSPFHSGNIDVRTLLAVAQAVHGRLFWLAAAKDPASAH